MPLKFKMDSRKEAAFVHVIHFRTAVRDWGTICLQAGTRSSSAKPCQPLTLIYCTDIKHKTRMSGWILLRINLVFWYSVSLTVLNNHISLEDGKQNSSSFVFLTEKAWFSALATVHELLKHFEN